MSILHLFIIMLAPTFVDSRPMASPLSKVRVEASSKGQKANLTSINVVMTHAICDFDSLASAVGLAKVWNHMDPTRVTVVVMPQGAHSSVERFMALHSVLFPIRQLSTLSAENVHKVGVVDASTRDRLGPGVNILDRAEEVYVFDHHAMKIPDIKATKLYLDNVGSLTTTVVEMLRETGAPVNDAEATLLAIGIHADTGSMTFDSTTYRDAEALACTLRWGAKQAVIAEYCQTRLTQEQQIFLSKSFHDIQTTQHMGVTIGTVLVDCGEYVGGLARVAQHVLELTSCDVLIWGGLYVQGAAGPKQSKKLVLIGRARSGHDFVNFDEIFKPLGGGGHCKAAAANIRFDPANPEKWPANEHVVLDFVINKLKAQITAQKPNKVASDIMSYPVLTVTRETSMRTVAQILGRYGFHSLPVVSMEPGEEDMPLGIVGNSEVLKALKTNKLDTPASAFFRQKILAVDLDTPVDVIKQVMIENDGRDVLVMGSNERVAGLISRTDILKQYNFYSESSFPLPEVNFYHKDFTLGGASVEVAHVVSAAAECPEFFWGEIAG